MQKDRIQWFTGVGIAFILLGLFCGFVWQHRPEKVVPCEVCTSPDEYNDAYWRGYQKALSTVNTTSDLEFPKFYPATLADTLLDAEVK